MLKPLFARSLPCVLLAAALPARGVEVTPVFNASLSAGQYFFQGQRGSFSGNSTVVAAPLIKLSPRWSMMPMYLGNYRGTKGVDDGVGAGTLFQQEMDHRLSVTGIRVLEGTTWRLKPQASYKREFLKETRDETWGKGLFDYEKIAVGLEAENLYKDPFVFRAAVDLWRTRFPQYESLESRSGTDPSGNPLGRELAPRKVLDAWNAQLTLSGSRPVPFADPAVALQASWSFLYQNYSEQKVVNARGQFDRTGRRDLLNSASLSVVHPRPVRLFGHDARLDLTGGLNLAYNASNQNTFDAAKTQFVPDAYGFWSFGLGPAAALSWGDRKTPERLSMGLRWNRVRYTGRLVQDGDGVYSSAKQYQDRTTLSLGFDHPVAPKFTLTTRVNALWASSNHKFDKNYKYTYRAMTYHIGVAYEY
ncbi:MAG: hypothetical protein SF051_10085 [Elusimicrobiota bacterium]|nr:hypothetical protein [Elusimicrobiota bacterium]